MLKHLFKAMRPRQWTKNAFVFAALVFDRQLLILTSLFHTFLAFLIFCLLSSSVYLINDIMDVEADRNHPVKKNRPIASGNLPIPVAIIAAVVLIIISLTGAYFLSFELAIFALIYLLINLAYSKWLKHIPLIDVLIIATGFVLRVAAGVSVIHVERFSPWLYVVTTLFALYIGFGKRRAEMSVLATSENKGAHRKVLDGYSINFIDQLITVVSSTTLIAYSLYTFSAPNLPDNHAMMLTIPFVLYGIFRYLFLIQMKNAGGEPEELLLKDHPLQAAILLWGLAVVIIFYIF
ncbi:MAG: decaprenyl-phosphate phosphoribosyltransferase [Anaerolineaceae bacterium]